MTDRELLELAAKAAGWKDLDFLAGDEYANVYDDEGHQYTWNPLTDDGDALRLAVKLGLLEGGLALMLNSRLNQTAFAQCYTNENVISPQEYMLDDPYAATRRAIVRAAAEIGKEQL